MHIEYPPYFRTQEAHLIFATQPEPFDCYAGCLLLWVLGKTFDALAVCCVRVQMTNFSFWLPMVLLFLFGELASVDGRVVNFYLFPSLILLLS